MSGNTAECMLGSVAGYVFGSVAEYYFVKCLLNVCYEVLQNIAFESTLKDTGTASQDVLLSDAPHSENTLENMLEYKH